MVLGYDQLRPTSRDYEVFLTQYIDGLTTLAPPGFSMMLYGSFVRKTHTVGRSDIDAITVFPHDVVLDEVLLRNLSSLLSRCLAAHYVPLSIGSLDLTIARDGRFSFLFDPWREYLGETAQVVHGPDYRSQMCFLATKTEHEGKVAFNLRDFRNGLLFSEYHETHDYQRFLENFNAATNMTVLMTRHILYLATQRLYLSSTETLRTVGILFPELDLEPLARLHTILTHVPALDRLYHRPDDLKSLWYTSLRYVETLLRAHMRHSTDPHPECYDASQ